MGSGVNKTTKKYNTISKRNQRIIYKNKKFKTTKDMPILEDLYNKLEGNLKTRLKPFVYGSLSYLNKHTNVELNNSIIIADIYELGEENIKFGMYIFIELFWDKIKKDRNEKKAIYLDEIWRLIESKTIKNKTLIMADIQTNGKGTHGRIWHTDEEKNIAFSYYIETNCKSENLEGITIEIAQILVKIFKEFYGIKLDIKKPNDIMIKDKKVGGILTESKVSSEIVKFLVIGIGINTEKMNFTDDIKNIATSIKKEFGIEVDRKKIITNFCEEFEKTLIRRIKKCK